SASSVSSVSSVVKALLNEEVFGLEGERSSAEILFHRQKITKLSARRPVPKAPPQSFLTTASPHPRAASFPQTESAPATTRNTFPQQSTRRGKSLLARTRVARRTPNS